MNARLVRAAFLPLLITCIFVPSGTRAEMRGSDIFSLMGGGAGSSGGAPSFHFSGNAGMGGEGTGVSQGDLGFSVPVWAQGKESVSLTANGGWLGSAEAIHLPQDPSGDPGIKNLYSLEFGASYTRGLDDKKFFSLSGTYGSASDRPFADSNVTTLSSTATYSIPGSTEKSRWFFFLSYSNNRPILNNIPLPGFAYSGMLADDLRILVGLPFLGLKWNPDAKWEASFFSVAPWIVNAEVSYALSQSFRIFSAYRHAQDLYLRLNRAVPENRFQYDEKKLMLGVRTPLSVGQPVSVDLELSAGRAFARSFFEAKNYIDRQSDQELLPSEGFVATSFKAHF